MAKSISSHCIILDTANDAYDGPFAVRNVIFMAVAAAGTYTLLAANDAEAGTWIEVTILATITAPVVVPCGNKAIRGIFLKALPTGGKVCVELA